MTLRDSPRRHTKSLCTTGAPPRAPPPRAARLERRTRERHGQTPRKPADIAEWNLGSSLTVPVFCVWVKEFEVFLAVGPPSLGDIRDLGPRTSMSAFSADGELLFPEKLTQLEERPYIAALGNLTQNPSAQYADLEKNHNLRERTLKPYVRWSRQKEAELKEAARKQSHAAPKKRPADFNPAQLSGSSTGTRVSSVHWGESFQKTPNRETFAKSEEYLRDALLQAGNDALKRHLESKAPGKPLHEYVSLWAASEIAANFMMEFKTRAVFNCASQLQANPNFEPVSAKGGRQTPANNPIFVANLKAAIEARDPTLQNTLAGEDLEAFILKFYQEFFSLNPHAVLDPIPTKTMRKLKKAAKLKGRKIHFVSHRRWEAMGDVRNYVSYYCAIFLAFRGVPLELRFNWDDTSLFVCADSRTGPNRFLGLAWTTKEQLKKMQALHRSVGVQLKQLNCTPRMVMWGILGSACGRCHLCVVKIYDRSIAAAESLRWYRLPESVGECDIVIMFIRGKQLGTGAVADEADEAVNNMAHGGYNDGHADECQVARVVFGELVGPKVEEIMKKYFAMHDSLLSTGFQAGNPASADPAAPASAAPAASAALDSDPVPLDSSSEEESDDSDSELVSDALPSTLASLSHPHALSKVTLLAEYYRCKMCNVEGTGIAYTCSQCTNCFFHPRCVIPDDSGIDLTTEDSAILAYVRQLAREAAIPGAIERRAGILADGACGQTKALVGTEEEPGVIVTSFLQKNIDVVKGSAQCSPSQNPLDCMRSFLMAKADKCKWTFENASPSGTMMTFIETIFARVMSRASASDRNTFKLSLMHVEKCISKNFNRHVMQAGWEVAGLIDLNFHKVMSHWAGYENLSCEAVNGLIGLLPPFLYEMGTTFVLSDRSMKAMQRFFPIDFKVYPTDRSSLGYPRQRATMMSWAVEAHAKRAQENVEIEERMPEEPRPTNPTFDPKGLAICSAPECD